MSNKILTVGLLITLIIAIGGFVYPQAQVQIVEDPTGRASGPAHYQHESFLQGMSGGARDQFSVSNVGAVVHGGSSMATTTNAAGTFTAKQICDNSLIVATPNIGAVTLTFPTTAQLVADCLPRIGSSKVVRLQNATTTTGAPSILTLANGTGGDHQEGEGGTTVIEGLEWAEITFMNIDGTNHLMDVRVTQPAD